MKHLRFISMLSIALAVSASAGTIVQRGAVFRSIYGAPSVKIISDDELEFTPEREGPNLVCKYSRDGDSLRVVATVLGSPQAIYFKLTPEGLQSHEGTILYDASHLDAATKAAVVAEQERQRIAALTPSAIPRASPEATRPIAIFSPRPEYPYEARRLKVTGAGIALITIEPPSGTVKDVAMLQSTGSAILDNAIVAGLRRWRFQPGSYDPHFKMPISYTLTGATF